MIHFSRWESEIYIDRVLARMSPKYSSNNKIRNWNDEVVRGSSYPWPQPIAYKSSNRPTRNKHQHYHMLYINKYMNFKCNLQTTLETLNSINLSTGTSTIYGSHQLAFSLSRGACSQLCKNDHLTFYNFGNHRYASLSLTQLFPKLSAGLARQQVQTYS